MKDISDIFIDVNREDDECSIQPAKLIQILFGKVNKRCIVDKSRNSN
jgi:N-formylglutamate amidohydrolase